MHPVVFIEFRMNTKFEGAFIRPYRLQKIVKDLSSTFPVMRVSVCGNGVSMEHFPMISRTDHCSLVSHVKMWQTICASGKVPEISHGVPTQLEILLTHLFFHGSELIRRSM